jgi:hypothetical protein
MTITLNISPEAEAALSRSASLAGKPLSEFAAELLEDAALQAAPGDPASSGMIEHLRRIGVIGAVQGKPRADGRSWSEIEAASDPH